jgi:hypothetical protein
MQNIFYRDLNDLCRKYLVLENVVSTEDAALAVKRFKDQEASLFEQLLLFDQISLKVHGENIPLAVLLNVFGDKAFEALIEQDAIKFVLWTTNVFYMKSNVPGVHPIASGNFTSPAHTDPEASIELGLAWLRNKPSARRKRYLVKKIAPKYVLPNKELSVRAVDITKSAFDLNKLNSFGLSPLINPIENMRESERSLLCECATELLEYSFMIEHGMSSYSKLSYFDLFSNSVQKIREASAAKLHFNELAKLEGLPDLKSLYPQLESGLRQLPKLRNKRSSRKFREWLSSTEGGKAGEIAREYIEDIANARGILDGTGGKFTKSVVMTAVGTGIGAAIGASPLAAVSGGLVAKLLEPAAEFGLDLVDNFLLDRLLRGWTPRMFFDDLKKLPPARIDKEQPREK